MAGTQVFLDADSYLPYRIITHPLGGAIPGQATSGRQRTFTSLEINGAVTNTDFGADFPPGTATIYEQAHMAPRLAVPHGKYHLHPVLH